MCLFLHIPSHQVLSLELENSSYQHYKTKITGFPTDTSATETLLRRKGIKENSLKLLCLSDHSYTSKQSIFFPLFKGKYSTQNFFFLAVRSPGWDLSAEVLQNPYSQPY